jgi:hypothetical protein
MKGKENNQLHAASRKIEENQGGTLKGRGQTKGSALTSAPLFRLK